ncbi:MAG: c-type cytochrome [Ignavibacteria bacterium]|nr:c-type cytochrome [Ignavibacteria bacterium]
MKTKLHFICITLIFSAILFNGCSEKEKETAEVKKILHGGYESQVKWGEHLVMIGGCNDCHTPKKMSPKGPVPDMELTMSGHPAALPPPEVDRAEMEKNGLVVTRELTSWIGPWGISFASNLTPDQTGIGNWQESSFIIALREGKYKGMPSGRSLLPPMPWEMYKNMTDDEIKAIFAYLKSLKPINNLVPQPVAPVSPPPGN